MDYSLHAVSDGGDMPWSDSNSMVSDDGFDGLPQAHSPWTAPLSAVSTAMSDFSNAQVSPNGCQLSPISNNAELAHNVSGMHSYHATHPSVHAHSMAHSVSTGTGSWDMGCCDDAEDMAEMDDGSYDNIHWDQASEDILTVPKAEPLDEDDMHLDDVKEAPTPPNASMTSATSGETKIKRPRGRPRKHPVTPIVTGSKITKGRSKTGCLTCRKRKKKCDEAKPRCMNCEKNAVVCEGYPEKQIWKSGRERAEEDRLRLRALPKTIMEPSFNGLETAEDMVFWNYYHDHLSNVLTVESEHKNAFKSMIVPIAFKNMGLMHSILSLASKHIDYDTPYSVNLLKKFPKTSVEALKQRSVYHSERAMAIMQTNLNTAKVNRSKDTVAALYGQMLCMVLESRAEGQLGPAYRIHLRAYKALIRDTPPEDVGFQAFVTEFLQYQIFADELIRIPTEHDGRLATENWEPSLPIPNPRLIGVADGLFNVATEITTLRNEIRERKRFEDTVSYHDLFRASNIDWVIRSWTPAWPAGDSRQRVALLYLQVLRIYLLRTVSGPRLSPSDTPDSLEVEPTTSDSATQVFPVFPVFPASPAQTPPHSAPASASSSPRLPKSAVSHIDTDTGPSLSENAVHFVPPSPRSNPPSRKNSGTDAPALTAHDVSHTDGHYASYQTHSLTASQPLSEPFHSPQDTSNGEREPDKKISSAVSAALDILGSFSPSDPSQTLLLPACLVVGAACWTPDQRERARRAVRAVRGYTGMRNGDTVMSLLEQLWARMDAGDWEAAWDWQAVAGEMGLDFLCA